MGWIADLHQSRGEQPGRSDTGRSLPSIGVWAQALLRTLIRGSARKWQQRSLPSLIFCQSRQPPAGQVRGSARRTVQLRQLPDVRGRRAVTAAKDAIEI